MRIHKKIISIALAFVLVITGLPLQFIISDDSPNVYAYETTPTVDISYEVFSNTEGLQLNGDSLIENGSIQFESGVGTGESVFTRDKLILGADISFSTAFSFRNISPSTPAVDTKGGFTFTLQTVANSVYASDFYDESIFPSLSIAFTSDYIEGHISASLIDKTPKLLVASLDGFRLAEGPSARCSISAVPYINGDFNNPISQYLIDTYYTNDESSEYYHAWIGYDGVKELLHVFCQAPSGEYTYFTEYMNLAGIMSTNEVYAGFMGSLGDAGNTTEISSWYFRDDLSIIHEAAAEADKAWLTSEMERFEAGQVPYLQLPLAGPYDSSISWISGNTAVVAEDGTVNPPTIEQGDQTVTLTAIITKGSVVRETRTFTFTIKVADSYVTEADYGWLTDSVILNENGALNNIVSDLSLPNMGQYGSSISWGSSNVGIVAESGTVIRPSYFDGDQEVILTAYITMNTATLEKSFKITVKALGVSDAEIVDADQLWLTGTRILNGNISLDKVTENLNLPVFGQYGSSISWESSNEGVVAIDGTVTRPALAQGDQTVTLTAIIKSGEAVRENTFTVTVTVRDEDKVLADSAWLADAVILKGNRSLNNIVSDLNLPVIGSNGSTISWTTSGISVVSANGKVTRPALGSGNIEVTLMATISSGAATPAGRYFSVTVRAIGNSDEELVEQDKEWLTDTWIKNLNSSLNMVTTDLILRTEGLIGGSTISWESSDSGIVDINGRVTRPTYTQGGKSVSLTATISKGVAIPVTKVFTVYVIALEQTPEEKYIEDEAKVNADYEWLEDAIILNGNSALENITGNLSLPILGDNGSTISWESTDTGIVNVNGIVTKPSFTQGNKTVTLTAAIGRGAVTPVTKIFIVTVIALEEAAEEKVNADYAWLVDTEILNGNSSLDNVTNNLKLPAEGPNGSSISWASDNAMVVDTEGRVTRQSYTHGDRNVMLTATISMGLSVTKTFTVKVIKLEQTAAERDAEKVNADNAWLVAAVILKDNSALNSVTGDLNLPTIGENGSVISWTSSSTEFVREDGIVTRPTYTQGSKSITLTAAIKMGSSEVKKPFNITVAANLITNEELVAKDYEWLTEEIILNGNSSLDNVTELLYLPTNGMDGIPGSRISWASSHHGFVTIGGNVYRPMYHSGDQTVTLTATISKEAATMKKTFTIVVKCLDLTDTEAVDETSKWLNRYNILEGNLSESSVTQDLSFPTTGLYGAAVAWSSDSTNIITNGGVVTRPANRAGNRRVNVTAVVTKGGLQATVTFQYIVLEEPDRTAPAVISAVPANNSTGVLWDTNTIVITYNENIVLAQNHGIELKAAADIQLAARAENKKLIVTPFAALSSGENRLLIPAGVVADAAGNSVEAYELKFTVEDKPVRNIEIISSSPYDTEKDVAINLDRITIKFDSGNLVKGKYFDTNFTLRTVGKSFFESEFISLPGTLSNDTLTIKLNKTLTPATVYEIIINEGDILDRFLNKNSAKIIQFRTKGTPPSEIEAPEVASVYPADGQTGVSVNPNIEVAFTKIQKLGKYQFKLTDVSGREYPLSAPYTFDLAGTNLIFKPKETLEPNNVYTLSGPYDSVINPYKEEFRTIFATGSGPQIIKTSPATGDFKAPTRGIVQVYFDVPVTKGFNFNNIRFEDCIGRPVEFVGEETENKAVLRAVTELERHIPYTIYFPSGAYKNAAGVASGQNKITFVATEESLPTELGLQHLDIPDTGFVGKALRISIDNDEMISWVNYIRSLGYTPISYEWRIDGELADTFGLFYKTFSSPGEKEITLTIKDKYGYTYSINKTVEIKALQQVRMSLKDSGKVKQINTSEEGTQPSLDFELRLEQENRFIYGENIKVKLYKGGVLQPLSKYNDGVIYITSKYSDNAYKYTYTPKYGDAGTYELVFTYNGSDGEQVIRQPFIVTSKVPAVTDVLRFRLYADKSASYYEELNYVYVMLNGERIRANKEMYTYNGSTFPVYALRKTLQTNTYYNFKVEEWWGDRDHVPFYLGRNTDNPVILSGRRSTTGTAMQVRNVTINNSESDLKEYNDIYFEGLSTKLVYNVEGDWGTRDTGYYEIAIIDFDKKDSGYGHKEYQVSFKQAHDNKTELQKIAVKPGVQLKGVSEQYLVRMVSPQGYKSSWMLCPNVSRLSMPEIMGKKLNISVQDGEYAVNWPTVFDGPIGGTIDALNGIPVIDGGNFGMGGGMPSFEGEVLAYGGIELSFEAKGGYGESNKTSTATKLKKVKKVAVVGYEFEIELEGGITLDYNWYTDEWVVWYFYIVLDGDITKEWDKGYEILGVGFTAGVSVGTGVSGALIIKEEDGTKYSGYIGLSPHAGLHVDGDFAVASVKGELTAKIPAEIHFPTGYIGAGINVDASIKAKALIWEKTLYEKELYEVHWDNGKEKVTLKSLLKPAEKEGSREAAEPQLMPRDYLNRQSNWLGENDSGIMRSFSFMGAKTETNPRVADMMENIFPEAEVKLVVIGEQQWLVWTDDNPSRDEINRTQLRCSVLKEGTWSEPAWIGDDGTADFDPVVAAAGEGVLMAWHNIGKILTEDEGLEVMLNSSEISVTESVYTADGSQPGIINLTEDDKLDHSPRLAADGDKALLVWTKSEGSGLILNMEEGTTSMAGDQLYFSKWSDGTWTAPEAIVMNVSTILDSSLTMEGEEGLLLYTLDVDNNFSTGEDREVYARLYDGNAWGEAIYLTRNALNDSAPKAVCIDGDWFITWLEDGKILYKAGLEAETRTEESLDNIQSNYQITVSKGERPLVALIYTQAGEDKALEMYSSFYDFDNEKWSGKIGLVTGDKYTNAISASFNGDGELNAAFTQADIITEAKPVMIDNAEELVETRSISNKVDLKILTYTPVHDIALQEEEGILLSTEFPLPGTVVTVYTVLENAGDFAENVTVYLYDGNPEVGGIKIAEAAPRLISARSTKEIEIEWLVGSEEKNEYDLYAVAQPNDGVEETTIDNNTVSMKVFTSDIAITGLTCENPAADDYLINVTIANMGGKVLDGAKVWLEDDVSGEILETTLIEAVELGEETVLTYMLPANGREKMRVRVTLPEEVNEGNRDNNIRTFILEPAPCVLKSLNIGPGDKQVAVENAVSLEFNMSIGEGSGFEQIRLIDEELNIIAIDKVIEENILTIKPQNLLEYGTVYRLTIPADALGDIFGHALGSAFDMSFTTITTNPEVVSAYPGAGMNNTAVDTAIRLKYNQMVIQGYEFSKIALYEHKDGLSGKGIPISPSIEGELLTMNYAGSLNENTTYTLEIPRGAVENDSGETQREDYVLAFTTGEADEGDGQLPSDDNDDDDDNDNNNNIADNGNQASVDIDGTNRAIPVQKRGSNAVIKLGIMSGEIVVNVPTVPGTSSYTLEMPAETLTSGKSSLTLKTALGSVSFPSGMLSTMKEAEGKTVGLTITAVDKSTLPEAIRAAIGNRPVIKLTLTLNGVETAWSNPEAPVWVSIPYKPTDAELESPESIVIWYIDAKGNIINVPNGFYNQSDGMVSFNITHFSDFAVAYNKVSFKDVKKGIWYERAVNFIAAREITTGTGNGYFSPNSKLTRGQLITMLMRACGIDPDTNPKENFSDAGNTWYTGYLAVAKRLGISEGVGNNMFAPEKEITRQEMFTLLYNLLRVMKQFPETKKSDEVSPGRTLSEFTDEGQIASWAREAMSLLVETDTISGNAGKLAPQSTATRAEMARVLYNLMVRISCY